MILVTGHRVQGVEWGVEWGCSGVEWGWDSIHNMACNLLISVMLNGHVISALLYCGEIRID